jgi:hypothetical protein
MKFIVEVPTYLQLEVEACDGDQAALIAEAVAARTAAMSERAGHTTILPDAKLLLLNPKEDRAPDVYICRGGKLTEVAEDGNLYVTGDGC